MHVLLPHLNGEFIWNQFATRRVVQKLLPQLTRHVERPKDVATREVKEPRDPSKNLALGALTGTWSTKEQNTFVSIRHGGEFEGELLWSTQIITSASRTSGVGAEFSAYPHRVQGWTKVWTLPARSESATLVERFAQARGIAPSDLAQFLAPSWSDLRPLDELAGVRNVGARLAEAVRTQKHIAIFGDYDADGMCAAAILVHFIRAARNDLAVTVYIPSRATEGYGLSKSAVEHLASIGCEVVVTVDCGITALDEALEARRLGIELLITDHHAIRSDGILPQAEAIAHPALGTTPSALCGAAVAWKVGWAFACAWCENERVSPVFRTLLTETIALAALATITDVVPLGGDAARDNRTIVRLGAPRIATSGLPGLRALAREAGIGVSDSVDAERISFGIGPILNACGRLGNAQDAVGLLGLDCSSASDKARTIASQFGLLNADRKQKERMIVESASKRIEEGLGRASGACVLASGEWQRGIVGIACARLSDKLNKPVILLESAGEFLYGSARGVAGYSVLDGLHACRHHLDRYGGHAAAAGITLRADRLEAFREEFSSHAASHRDGSVNPSLIADAILEPGDVSIATFESLAAFGPFGMGFPPPTLLMRRARVTQPATLFGADGDHIAFHVTLAGHGSSDAHMRCTWWRQREFCSKIKNGMLVDLLVRPQVDRWRMPARPACTVIDISDAG